MMEGQGNQKEKTGHTWMTTPVAWPCVAEKTHESIGMTEHDQWIILDLVLVSLLKHHAHLW